MVCPQDGYGVSLPVRGVDVAGDNLQRQEILLNLTGEPCVLISKKATGVFCNCYTYTKEYPDDRCPNCLGSGFVIGWTQTFNPRRSDGRIMVRFDAAVEDIPYLDAGQENTYAPNCWTLAVPTLHDRDVIVRFDKYTGNEVARFEVLNVTRNVTLDQTQGAQKFAVVRIRKTDSVYKFDIFKDTSDFPAMLTTGIGMVPGLILPHTHTVEISEKILTVNQIQWNTSYTGAIPEQAHSHQIINGIVQESLGHTHTLVL